MRSIAFSLTLVGITAAASAQCFEPNFGTPLGTVATLIGDIVLPIQPIGFAFPLAGTTYTDVHISDKGYVWLSNGGTPAPAGADFTATFVEFASQGPRIAPLWADLQTLPANNGQIYLNSSATRCVITWENSRCYSNTCAAFTMQAQLFPSGEVDFFWGPGATNNSTQAAWQFGVCGVSPGAAAAVPAVDLSAGGTSTANLLGEEFAVAGAFDMAARGLRMIPTNPGWVYLAPTGCAATAVYGTGCVPTTDSVYEQFTGGIDLANTTLTWLRTPGGYTLLNSVPGTFVPPSATAVNLAQGALDGSQVVTLSSPMPVAGGTTTTLCVTTKGQIQVASTPPTVIDYTPSVAELLNDTRTQFAFWHDFNQTAVGSGLILYEEVAGVAYVTWNGVYSFSAASPTTFQFQLNLATGTVTLVIGAIGGVAAPDTGIVGYSVAGPSNDPGPSDLSALSVVSVVDSGAQGLALAGVGSPQLGNATFALATSGVPLVVPIGIQFFGTAVVNPGLDLTFLGMPGCFAYTNGNLGSVSFPVSFPAATGSVTLPIPNNLGLVGTVLSAQSIAFSLATPFNLVSSNGLQITIGF